MTLEALYYKQLFLSVLDLCSSEILTVRATLQPEKKVINEWMNEMTQVSGLFIVTP